MRFTDSLVFGWRRRLPMLQQTQAAECGLACVGMIAGYYGHHFDLVTLRHRFSTSLKGATLADIMQIAHRLGMASRALRLELDELDQLSTPCILHWEMNHFVVLKKVTRNKVILHDPARGLREVSMEEVSKSFTGVALELLPSASFQRLEEKQSVSMRRLVGGIIGLKSVFAQILIMSLALELFGILTPFFMQWVMDMVLVSADRSLLTLLGSGFIIILLLQNVVSALRSWVMAWFSSMLSVQWSANVFSWLLGLPMAFFEARHVGDIVSRFGSIGTIQNTLTTRFISTVLDGVMAFVTLGLIFAYNAKLTVLVIGLFVTYMLIRFVSWRPFRRANEEQIIAAARTQTQLLETIRGAQAVKLNNKEEVRLAAYANALVESTNKGIAIQRLSISFTTLQGTIAGVGRIVLIWLAALQVLEGNFSAGMLVAFISFSDQFIARASGLIDALLEFRMLRLHGERIADIVLTEKEEDRPAGAIERPSGPRCSGPGLTVRDLSFRYAENEPWILHQCDFSIAPGENVAIVGRSGQGKTTLAKLLLGLLKPQQGEITVAGVDIRRTGMQAHRARIGCVMQDDILFAGSIAENISFFDAEPSPQQVEVAAQQAQIHDDIVAMPMGYQTLVGDMGSSLSGGQIQRVLLARALYRQPEILLLDEASSHLDIERERLINAAIRQMPVTRIIIAHRPETIRSADRVIVIDQGRAHSLDADSFIALQSPPQLPG
ncbi:ATP-binding cassette domain-containing protein [Erwinia sp. E602]|uniref:peptidase domain-containing ABC transporter n=1 Tax=Erwinia sp. E602 TaxID=2675378 RepID=UPI001BAA3FB7|nr:peptidase domain-containing ABC transporter [Erwinia sp. E602]QUG77702.1 ATP-binding cassette domain-containing protein [Erwinia sp. E602]